MKKFRVFAQGLMALGMALTLTAWQPTQPALAAAFTVNNNGDAGDASPGNGVCATSAGVCTLRAAIQEANATAAADTITIPAMTIVVNTQLLVTKSVTINGAGQGSTIIDGNNATRVFNFQAYSGTHSLSGLTIRNANYVDTSGNYRTGGGGIYNEATLTVLNVAITNSRANQGGGIFNALDAPPNIPSLILDNVTLTNNTATSGLIGQGGGGLYNGAALSGQNVTITGNTAQQGGGYYNNSYQTGSLTNFTLNNNTAKFGGGLNVDVGAVNLSNGAINGNFANCCSTTGGNTGGGGIYLNDGTLTLTNVTISGNTANSPGGYGGGLYSREAATLTNVTVSGNTAAYGAGIYNGNYDGAPNNMTLTNVTVSGNIGRNNTSPLVDSVGGGIYNTVGAQLTATNATITSNTARVAGGVENRSGATLSIKNVILAGNTATLNVSPDCRGALTNNDNNLLGNTSGCTFSPKSGDVTNANPALGPLQNNGGSTLTHALLGGSPAIDRGTNSGCPATDQRGVNRPVNGSGLGAVCDMGSVEIQGAAQANFRVYVPLVQR